MGETAVWRNAQLSIVALALLGGGIGGTAASRILDGSAAAATTIAYPPATITVPPGGLLFRTPDGRTVATLTSDEQGGHLTIMNRAGSPVAALGAFVVGGGGALTLGSGAGQAPLQLRADGPQASIFLQYGDQSAVSIQSFPWGGFLTMNLNPSQGQPAMTIVDSRSRVQRWHAP
jgi:hypothetical protein